MRGVSPVRPESSAPAAQRPEASAVPPRPVYDAPGSPALTRRTGFDCLIVGAGFAGSVLAERLAAGSGQRVLLIDRRPHIGGNAFDHYNDHGILVHRYGPHIFHTNAPHVAAYLSRFTRWRPYEHRVLAQVDGMLVPIPINLTTINRLYGLSLAPAEVEAFLAERAEPVGAVVNYPSEQVAHTRITEYKHLTGQKHVKTSITYEYPAAEGDPYYPVPRAENAALFRHYQTLADATPDVTFVGRLASYRYYNMDQVVAQALSTYARMVKAGVRAPVLHAERTIALEAGGA